MEQIHQEHAKVFRALCDPKRLAILELLREGEQCACMLMDRLGMGQSAVSYHMKILCESGIVASVEAFNALQITGLILALTSAVLVLSTLVSQRFIEKSVAF